MVTDPVIAATGLAQRVVDAAQGAGLDVGLYDQVHVEPTDDSDPQSLVANFVGVGRWFCVRDLTAFLTRLILPWIRAHETLNAEQDTL